jgi:TetR/AcrR family transcriptional regulator, transcriptional repressor for nem operon
MNDRIDSMDGVLGGGFFCKFDRSVYFWEGANGRKRCKEEKKLALAGDQVMSKAEKTRQFIIGKAAPIFNKKGVAGTSISDIMEATKLAKGGIYGNFTTKEEIAIEAFDYMVEAVISKMMELTAQKKSSKDKLFAILEFYRTYPHKPVISGGCPILNFGVEADDNNPVLKKKVKDVIHYFQDSIEKLVQRGIDYGEFRQDWDARTFAIKMFSMIEGGVLISRIHGDNRQMSILVDLLQQEIMGYLVR